MSDDKKTEELENAPDESGLEVRVHGRRRGPIDPNLPMAPAPHGRSNVLSMGTRRVLTGPDVGPEHDEELDAAQAFESAALERARLAEERMGDNSDRALLGQERAAKFKQLRMMFTAQLRNVGRMKISKRDLNSLPRGAGFSVRDLGDHLVITYMAGEDG